jgi:hypothetical protein
MRHFSVVKFAIARNTQLSHQGRCGHNWLYSIERTARNPNTMISVTALRRVNVRALLLRLTGLTSAPFLPSSLTSLHRAEAGHGCQIEECMMLKAGNGNTRGIFLQVRSPALSWGEHAMAVNGTSNPEDVWEAS